MRESLSEMMSRLANNPVVAKPVARYQGHSSVKVREIAREIEAEAIAIYRAQREGSGIGPEDSEA